MPEYDNELTGVLFKNDRKESEKHPDYKGSCEIDHREFWISCWLKNRKDGSGKFMSLAFTLKDGQLALGGATAVSSDVPIDTSDFDSAPVGGAPVGDDDIPF